MAGLEVVVRPVVFPNIRASAGALATARGRSRKRICVITAGKLHRCSSRSVRRSASSKSKEVETERRYDEVRVYQMDDAGTVDRDNFVDLEVANRIRMRTPRTVNDAPKRDDGRWRTGPRVIRLRSLGIMPANSMQRTSRLGDTINKEEPRGK